MTQRITHVLTLALALTIAWGTLSPPGDAGIPWPLSDKQIHALAFCLLVLPLSLTRPASIHWLAPCALAYGAAIELIQPFVGRSAEWGDLLADGIGIAVGIMPGLIRARLGRAA
jgi:hypothetical protein